MLTKLISALLLTVEAMALDDNCIELWEDNFNLGDSTTLCYASTDDTSFFKLSDYGIKSVGSYKAGSLVEFGFCSYSSGMSKCWSGAGPSDNWKPNPDIEDSQNCVELKYKI